MSKGSQNRDSKKAFNFLKSAGNKKKKCTGIFHCGGENLDLSKFKRMGDMEAQNQCIDCDGPRQSLQKYLKRLGALIALNPDMELSEINRHTNITNKIKKIVDGAKSYKYPLARYNYLSGQNKGLLVKKLGFYDAKITSQEKKLFIEELINLVKSQESQLSKRNISKEFISRYGNWQWICSACNKIRLIKEAMPNSGQNRPVIDIFGNNTGMRIPIHNVCSLCTSSRADGERYVKFLCEADTKEAHIKMNQGISKGDKSHMDHIVALRLGGMHKPENIEKETAGFNLKKKDKLMFECLRRRNLNLEDLLSSHYLEMLLASDVDIEFNESGKIALTDKNEIIIEAALRCIVDEYTEQIASLSDIEALAKIAKIYPTFSKKQLKRALRKVRKRQNV